MAAQAPSLGGRAASILPPHTSLQKIFDALPEPGRGALTSSPGKADGASILYAGAEARRDIASGQPID